MVALSWPMNLASYYDVKREDACPVNHLGLGRLRVGGFGFDND